MTQDALASICKFLGFEFKAWAKTPPHDVSSDEMLKKNVEPYTWRFIFNAKHRLIGCLLSLNYEANKPITYNRCLNKEK